MIEIVERKCFTNGSPVDSAVVLSADAFWAVGEIMVMCILQGGPAPNFCHLLHIPVLVENP